MKRFLKFALIIGILLLLFGCSAEYEEAATTAIPEPTRVETPEPEKVRPEPEPVIPDTYGDDPFFDDLWDRCEAGEFNACEDLYWESPLGSGYEAYADQRIVELNDQVTEQDVIDAVGPDFLMDIVWEGMSASDRADLCLGLVVLGQQEAGILISEGADGLITPEQAGSWLASKCR